jgi:hypothetical protein
VFEGRLTTAMILSLVFVDFEGHRSLEFGAHVRREGLRCG